MIDVGNKTSRIIAQFKELQKISENENRSYLMEHESKKLLELAGFVSTGSDIATTETEAVALAEKIGFPVVLKIASPDVIHKTDEAGVHLNLTSKDKVIKAFREITNTFKSKKIAGIAVQKMAEKGIEAIIGVTVDPNFGHVIMFGLGGIFVEVLKDVTFRALPVSEKDVRLMIKEIKGSKLLEGYRGISVDIDALVDTIMAVSKLVEIIPEIKELDINPLMLYSDGNMVIDARIFLAKTHYVEPYKAKADLKKIFYPDSIAVLGASDVPGKLGYNVFQNLVSHSYKGKLYPINPKRQNIHGYKCYPSISDVPEPIDLAVIIVPAQAVPAAVEECCAKGIKNLVVESAGFSETGDEGKAVQNKILSLIRENGVRLIGPNCSGIMNTHNGMIQSISLTKELNKGKIGLIAQAGVYAAGILAGLSNIMDFALIVTIGNKMDVNETDILEYMGTDDNINVISMYMENLSCGKRFVEVAKKVSSIKPVIALKSGRTEAGKKAASSHTASLAGNDEINDAVLRQGGIIRARDNEHMFGLVKAFEKQPLPTTDGIVIITYTGSIGVTAADVLYLNGLKLASFEPHLEKRLRSVMPDYVTGLNPVDFSFSMTPEQLIETIRIGSESSFVGGFIPVIQSEILDETTKLLKNLDTNGKPILACVVCKEFEIEKVIALERIGIPVYSTAEQAAEALGTMYRWKLANKNR